MIHKKYYVLPTLIVTLFAFIALLALSGYKYSEILGVILSLILLVILLKRILNLGSELL
jgi:uncharacterized membrane protein YfhO